MKKAGTVMLAMIVMLSCQTEQKTEAKLTKDREEVQNQDISPIAELMTQQEKAWNEADIDGFMKYYWQSDSLLFLSNNGPTYGWNTVLINYKKGYDSPEKMGRLQFELLEQKAMGNDQALVIGKWQVFRALDTLGGHFSLVWKKMKGEWKIVVDHTS